MSQMNMTTLCWKWTWPQKKQKKMTTLWNMRKWLHCITVLSVQVLQQYLLCSWGVFSLFIWPTFTYPISPLHLLAAFGASSFIQIFSTFRFFISALMYQMGIYLYGWVDQGCKSQTMISQISGRSLSTCLLWHTHTHPYIQTDMTVICNLIKTTAQNKK